MPTPPKVFISYSHDSLEHQQMVLQLANRFRTEQGIDCQIDQHFLPAYPAEGWMKWMRDQIDQADFVLMVCTKTYRDRFERNVETGGNGVGFEGLVISERLYEEHFKGLKFIPVICDGADINHVSYELRGKNIYSIPSDFQTLSDLIKGRQYNPLPPLGEIEFSESPVLLPAEQSRPTSITEINSQSSTDIFISYSRKDVEMVTILARTLEESGYSVWWDVSGLHGGQSFARVIQEKLAEAKCAIVVWSPDSVKSNWVHSEASFADKRGILVTAVYREAYAPMPFNNRHNENLRGWNGNVFDEGFQKLINAVHRHCPAPSGMARSNDAATKSPLASRHEAEPSPKETEPEELTPVKKKLRTSTNAAVTGIAAVAIGVGAYLLIPSKTIDDSIQSQTAVPNVTLESPKTVVNTDKKVPPLVKAINEPLATNAKSDFTKVSGSLLESAKTALKENRLISPENNSVVSFARLVLKADPENEAIKTVLIETTRNLHGLAELSFIGKSYLTAKSYLKESQRVIDEFALLQSQTMQDSIEKKFATAFTEGKKTAAEKAASDKVYKLENNLTLLPIPAGDFMMGTDSGSTNRKPAHKVTLDKLFWMSKTEITFAQYAAYARSTRKSLPNNNSWGRGSRPVINVSWNEAQDYVEWLSKNNSQELQCRLPSEAEWEYAARAGSTTNYFWGDEIGKNKANCFSCGSQWDGQKSAPVGSFPANKWGLHDMHGNVWEWVEDSWHKDYQGAPANGKAWLNNDNNRRALRGGSWGYGAVSLSSSFRNFSTSGNRFNDIGFRVVCSPSSVR